MKKEQIIRKFTSRKFILTLITNVAAIVAILVGDSVIVNAVAGLAIALVTTTYCVIEGKLDEASMKQTTEAVASAASAFGAKDSTVNKIEKVGEVVGGIIEDVTKSEDQDAGTGE